MKMYLLRTAVITGAIILITSTALFSQQEGQEQKTVHKINQYDLMNDVYFTYGLGGTHLSVYKGSPEDYNRTSPGGFFVGYERTLNKVIGLGFLGGYTPVSETPNQNAGTSTVTEHHYLEGLSRVNFHYLNKSLFTMYSGVALGVSMDYKKETDIDLISKTKELKAAWQITLLGVRVGRSIAGTAEIGFGTFAILSFGVSYKFGE